MSSNIWLQFQHCVLSKALWQVMALLDHSTWTGPPPSGPWDGGRISDNTLITLLVVAHWPTPTLAPPTCSLLPQHPKNTLQLVTQHSAHNPPFHWPLGGAAVCSCLYRPCLPSCGLALIWLKHVMNWPHQTSWGVGSGRPSTTHWTLPPGMGRHTKHLPHQQLQMSAACHIMWWVWAVTRWSLEVLVVVVVVYKSACNTYKTYRPPHRLYQHVNNISYCNVLLQTILATYTAILINNKWHTHTSVGH